MAKLSRQSGCISSHRLGLSPTHIITRRGCEGTGEGVLSYVLSLGPMRCLTHLHGSGSRVRVDESQVVANAGVGARRIITRCVVEVKTPIERRRPSSPLSSRTRACHHTIRPSQRSPKKRQVTKCTKMRNCEIARTQSAVHYSFIFTPYGNGDGTGSHEGELCREVLRVQDRTIHVGGGLVATGRRISADDCRWSRLPPLGRHGWALCTQYFLGPSSHKVPPKGCSGHLLWFVQALVVFDFIRHSYLIATCWIGRLPHDGLRARQIGRAHV